MDVLLPDAAATSSSIIPGAVYRRRAADLPWVRRPGPVVRSDSRPAEPCDPAGANSLLLHQRALAFAERPCSLLRRDRRDQLVVIPGILRFFGLLDLEQIGRKHLATVGANGALAEQDVVGRQLLHLGDDLGAVMRITSHRLQRLEIMQHA